jgi:hypothetical protein
VASSGLPAGFKLRVAGIVSTAAAGAGDTVSVDLLGTRLPVARLEILDASNTLVKTYTPSNGVWGGDYYSMGSAP